MPRPTNVVVLMLENRSFDHKLGFLKRKNRAIEGLTGDERNLLDPSSPLAIAYQATDDADHVGDLEPDPPHELADVAIQLYGRGGPADYTQQPDNSGFVLAYGLHAPGRGPQAMRCFAVGRLPAYHTLAREFAVCDHWFSSVPGPTWPNRFFLHCAGAGGFVDGAFRRYRMPSIFDRLHEAGHRFGIYYHDAPHALMLERLRPSLFKGFFHHFDTFLADAAAGTLPAYAFIEPRYFDCLEERANDEHPPHDVRAGDRLVARVYEAVRAGKAWESTLLVVLSDEHGGVYDHVPPPRAEPPGDGVSHDPPFGFDRLGVRVPALLISPHVQRGIVDTTVYDHASVPATLRRLFGLTSSLTRRDALANTFEGALSLAAPRTDTPRQLPVAIPPLPAESLQEPRAAEAPLSDWQRSLLAMVRSLDSGEKELAPPDEARLLQNEHAAAAYVTERVRRYLASP
jgi:phospholipase C